MMTWGESSFKRYGKKKHITFPFPKSEEPDLMNQSGHQKFFFFFLFVSWSEMCNLFWFVELLHAIAYVEGDNYYGAKANIMGAKDITAAAQVHLLADMASQWLIQTTS